MKLFRNAPPLVLLEKDSYSFPDLSVENGFEDLIAIGLDLDPNRIIEAYKAGIFPWFMDGGISYWFSPDPRMVLFPKDFKVSKSLSKSIRNAGFEVKQNENFLQVMRCCAMERKYEKTSWITSEYISSYNILHQMSLAHSIECYHNGDLVGGIYGVMIDRIFFGESMFAFKRDASKVALYALCQMDIEFIDCQVPSDHLKSLGAKEIGRDEYINLLKKSLS